MKSEVIAVTGASGRIGGLVAYRLGQAGVAFRPIARDMTKVPAFPGAEPAVAATYDDQSAMEAALAGVTTLFLVSGRETADRLQQHKTAVNSAVTAGVRRIVYLSFLGASPQAAFTLARQHWYTEEHIRASGLACTFLRDSLYMASFPLWTGSDGVIRGPAGNGRVAAVAHEDVADVASAVLRGDSHEGKTYDITGRERLSLADAAAELSRVIGKAVTYHAETVEEAYASRAHYGAPQFEVDGWVTSYVAIARGELDVIADTVQRVAGHPPRTLAEYLREHPEDYPHLGGPAPD